MPYDDRPLAPPTTKRLAVLVGVTVVAAAILAVAFIIPVTTGIDPIGIGQLTGLTTLSGKVSGAQDAATHETETSYRVAVLDIPLRAGGDEVDYKIRMKSGDSIVYAWSVADLTTPADFHFNFHGETPSGEKNAKPIEVGYKKSTGDHARGSLTAPMDGLHGWAFQNHTATPVVAHLMISGFFELIPPGEYGNEIGIQPMAVDTD